MLNRVIIDLVKEDLGLGKIGMGAPAGAPMMKAPNMPPAASAPVGGASKTIKIPGAQPKTQKPVSSIISPTNMPGGRQSAGRQAQTSAFN